MSELNNALTTYIDTHKTPNEVITFSEYLDKVRQNPGLAALAHKRVYDMIKSYGVDVDEETGEEKYRFFERELFGIEDSTKQVMEYFKGASLGSEVGRRFLLLFGPPSSGKSNLVDMIKASLEGWTKTEAGTIYAIEGCPMNEEPLHLIPGELRHKTMEELKVKIEGELCPVCAFKLKNDFKGDFTKFKVKRIYFSQQGRVGIGTFVPSDSKCVVGSTFLLSNNGLITFDEIQEKVEAKNDEFKSFEVEVSGINGVEKTSLFYNGMEKETIKVTTKLGYEIEGSKIHPILCLVNGKKVWKRLEEVSNGDYVVLQKGQMLFGSNVDLPQSKRIPYGNENKQLVIPKKMSVAFAKFLGYLISEGCVSGDGIWFTNYDKKIMEDFCICAQKSFNVEPKIYHEGKTASISSRPLMRWLEECCGIERYSANKDIPFIVRTAPQKYVLAFLEALSWGDSCVSSRCALFSNQYRYTCMSKRLVRQLQMMFLNLGVVGTFYEGEVEYEGEMRKTYSITCAGDWTLLLLSFLGKLSSKNTNESLKGETKRSNFDYIPGVSHIVKDILKKIKTSFVGVNKEGSEYTKKLGKWCRYAFLEGHQDHRKFTRESLANFIEDVHSYCSSKDLEPLSYLLEENDFIYLPVKKIEPGIQQVYDLTVPKTHSFCANGIVCHNSQDIAELIGSVDLSKIGEYGTESDPRAYRFDGELNIANRGMAEFVELLKTEIKFLYVLLTVTQEKNIKTPRFPLLSCDEVVISHTNESEYKKFVGEPSNEALIDRMIVCRVRYNLKVNEEVKIYEKLLSHGNTKDIHIAPHTLRVASIFAILSRLEEPKDKNISKVKKMKLYNGEDVEGISKADIPRLKKESPLEGMDGVSPRYVINRLITTAIRGPDDGKTRKFITPIDALRALKDGLETTSKFKEEEKQKYEDLLGLVKAEFDHIAATEVQKAFFVSFEDEAQKLMDNYIDNIEAYLDDTKLKDPISDEELEPDEKLMRSVENKIGISEEAKESFRNEVMRKVGSALRRGDKFQYQNHTRLREAIEKQLFEDRRDIIKMTITSRTKEPEELARINQVVDTLCKKHGYIPESANELLKYVSSMMAREK